MSPVGTSLGIGATPIWRQLLPNTAVEVNGIRVAAKNTMAIIIMITEKRDTRATRDITIMSTVKRAITTMKDTRVTMMNMVAIRSIIITMMGTTTNTIMATKVIKATDTTRKVIITRATPLRDIMVFINTMNSRKKNTSMTIITRAVMRSTTVVTTGNTGTRKAVGSTKDTNTVVIIITSMARRVIMRREDIITITKAIMMRVVTMSITTITTITARRAAMRNINTGATRKDTKQGRVMPKIYVDQCDLGLSI